MPFEDIFIPNPEDPFGLPPLPREWRKPPFKWEKPMWPHLRWPASKVKILVVTDGCYYTANDEDGNPAGFSLSIALQDAFDTAHPEHPGYARFEFTKAVHQFAGNPPFGATPGFESITFSDNLLKDFDEVWLFGVSGAAPYLSSGEVQAIEKFMDNGGGMLAMGDHEDLGLGLCGGIKRVRSMRKWWYTSPPPPAGMVKAPDSTDLTRNDTVHAPLPNTNVNAGQQNDATPQTIFPRYNYATHFWKPFRTVKYPHPVLCGPRGAIKVMPDHQHEGDCIMPHANFAGEYTGGVPVEIIADGKNVVGRTKGGYVITDPRPFGLLGVWNGHDPAADQGRVLVDSTWHHWFNVNLYGLQAENGDEYKDILAFFRNTAIWLAPKTRQAEMRRAGTRIFLLAESMFEHFLTLKDFRPELFYPIGVYARDALGRIAPQCQSAAWWWHWAELALPERSMLALRKAMKADIDNPLAMATMDHAVVTAVGGAINGMAVAMHKQGLEKSKPMGDELDRAAAEGGKRAIESIAPLVKRQASLSKALLADL
jgi:hypothetical protein